MLIDMPVGAAAGRAVFQQIFHVSSVALAAFAGTNPRLILVSSTWPPVRDREEEGMAGGLAEFFPNPGEAVWRTAGRLRAISWLILKEGRTSR